MPKVTRVLNAVYAATTSAPVADLTEYGCELYFCLPLGLDMDDVDTYLVLVTGSDDFLRHSDFVYKMLNDYFRRAGVSGRCLATQCVDHYWTTAR